MDKPVASNKLAADAKSEHVFLDLLSKFTAQGRDVCDTPGHNYAPTEFADQGSEGLSREVLKAAMKRLLFAKRIRVEAFGPPSRRRKRLIAEPQNGAQE
jgi:hypothetical protein